jgi:peptide-methionine (S)-S-oxide reductase
MNQIIYLLILISTAISTTTYSQRKDIKRLNMDQSTTKNKVSKNDTVTFGAGCFWCVEAIYQNVDGVISVTSGYSGGSVKNPTYEEVCSGKTGSAEVTQIVYDSKIISYDDLLEIFWSSHDPTTLNRQGYDAGTQYRSVIFYHNEKQRTLAEKYKNRLDSSGIYDGPIVTEISRFKEFYKAEDYHQNCRFVIQPKLEKFKKVFKNKLKMQNEK